MDVLSRAGRESLEPLKEAFQEKLDPDSLQEPSSAAIKPQETAFLIGQWLLRITPQSFASLDDFETAVQPLNDFLFCINGQIDGSFSPASSYLESARNTSAAIWSLTGRIHCKNRSMLSSITARMPSLRGHPTGPNISVSWARSCAGCRVIRKISMTANSAAF